MFIIRPGQWNEFLMKRLREHGYSLELLFVMADEDTMVERARRRAKATGRITKADHVSWFIASSIYLPNGIVCFLCRSKARE